MHGHYISENRYAAVGVAAVGRGLADTRTEILLRGAFEHHNILGFEPRYGQCAQVEGSADQQRSPQSNIDGKKDGRWM